MLSRLVALALLASAPPSYARARGLSPEQRRKAEALTSVWENDTPRLQYGYSEDIGDGRGFTSGRAGFCTGTGDALLVVRCYAKATPENSLAAYLPELDALEARRAASDQSQADTSRLTGWPSAWSAAAADPAFRACQDSVVEKLYYAPSLRQAAARGLSTALTAAALYDAQIMHGEEGVLELLAAADKKTGPLGPRATRAAESRWLAHFLAARARAMAQAPEWRENVYRVAAYEKLRRAGNFTLAGCLKTGEVSAADYWPGLSDERSARFEVCGK